MPSRWPYDNSWCVLTPSGKDCSKVSRREVMMSWLMLSWETIASLLSSVASGSLQIKELCLHKPSLVGWRHLRRHSCVQSPVSSATESVKLAAGSWEDLSSGGINIVNLLLIYACFTKQEVVSWYPVVVKTADDVTRTMCESSSGNCEDFLTYQNVSPVTQLSE